MPVKMHRDRLKRQGRLTQEKGRKVVVEDTLVGQAADTLSDAKLRAEYDRRQHAYVGGGTRYNTMG